MKLVFGLGNPGKDYEATRHNVGFSILSALAEQAGATFVDKPKFSARVAEVALNAEKVLLVQPHTYYNEVGRSYRSLIDFYKLDPADTLVVHDELALPFGTIRGRVGGSDAGNNGIKSINAHGGETSARLRIGINTDHRRMIGDTDFVLARFTADEHQALTGKVVPAALAAIGEFVGGVHAVTSRSVL